MENSRLNHINYLLIEINRHRLSSITCDCLITADGLHAEAHQFMLELASPTLEKIIHMIKVSNTQIPMIIDISTIIGVNDHFPKILEFIYSGKLSINERNVFGILNLAAQLKISFIINFCCKTISELLTLNNINYIYCMALDMKQTTLIQICQSFICFNFYNYKLSREIPELELDAIISDHRLMLWNNETKEIFVGHNYLHEFLRIIINGNEDYDDVFRLGFYHLSFEELKSTLLLHFRTKQSVSGSQCTSFNNFIEEKYYAVPSNFTCPVGRYLPFGMHPFQGQSLPTRTSLCSQTVLNTIGNCTPDKWKIKKITFYIAKKWNNVCSVVAGMDFTYQEIWNEKEIKVIKCHIENLKKYRVKELILSSKENIVKIRITHSWIVNSFTFESDQGHIFGPFGDSNPIDCQVQLTEIDIRQHDFGLLYLHGFHYIDIISCGWRICNQLSLECAFIDLKRVQQDYKTIIHHVVNEISIRSQNIDVDRQERDSNIAIINVRPITFWSNDAQ